MNNQNKTKNLSIMRNITHESIQAFNNSKNFKKQNMRVISDGNETKLFLHNNMIAKRNSDGLFITNAGWESNTTKERLNAIEGVSIIQRNFVWFLNGKEWNGELTKIK